MSDERRRGEEHCKTQNHEPAAACVGDELMSMWRHPKKQLLFDALREMYGSDAPVRLVTLIGDSFDPPEHLVPSKRARRDLDVQGKSCKILNRAALRIVRSHFLINRHPNEAQLVELAKQVAGVTQDQTADELESHVSNYFRQRRYHQGKKEKIAAIAAESHAAGNRALLPCAAPSAHRILKTRIVPASSSSSSSTRVTNK